MHQTSPKGGFTLIELLVVVAIVAILSVVVVLTLNPADMIRSSRDSNRLSDLATFQSAMNLYAQDSAVSGLPPGIGTSSVIYLSIPDPAATTAAGNNCSSLGLPALPAGYSYHCAGPNFYRRTDGTGWIPVNLSAVTIGNPLGQLPTDPTNSSSSGKYYEYATDGTTWKMVAVPESQKSGSQIASFQSGTNLNLLGGSDVNWVAVPGNSTFGTQNFSVMKYAAVCSDGNGNYLNDYDSGYHTYSDSSKNCTSANNRQIASLPGGWPIANISHTTATNYCAAIGAHLLTNDEYMTIVTGAAGVNSNWSGGSPGSGYMYSGHNDNVPANASPADGNDANGCAGTDGPASCGGTGSNATQRRTLTLSNGSVVWDFAGNVWQHVQRSVNDQGDLTTTMALPTRTDGLSTWAWGQYGNTTLPYVSAWTADVAQANVGPPNSSWNSSQGMGQVYTYGTGVNQGTTVIIRGASWTYGTNAGPFALYLDWGTGNTELLCGVPLCPVAVA